MAATDEPCVAWAVGGRAQLGWGVADERVATTPRGALELACALAAGAHGPGPWFGGLAFPAAKAGLWPAARFVRCERLEEVPLGARAPAVQPSPAGRADPGWTHLVERALDAIARGELEKVVVARVEEAPLQARGFELFTALPGAGRRFFFSGPWGASFLGTTPETLVRLRGGAAQVDALAGSAAVGADFGAKERREHEVVVRAVREAFWPTAVTLEPSVMELPYVRHLHTRVSGPAPDFARLLGRLFPTPAVAGAPREAALRFLEAHEGLDRGWYAGAVGRIAHGEVDLSVALRCAQVRDGRARLFAGAGIVAGSDPQAEWVETEAKLWPLREAISRAERRAA